MNILHDIAKSGDIDLLFVYICQDFDTEIIDEFGKKFYEYLEKYQLEKLIFLYNAFVKKKVFPNIIPENFNFYYTNGFVSKNKHMIELIWTYDLGTQLLEQILHSGFNFDLLNGKYIPDKYNKVLLEWGKWDGHFTHSIYSSNLWTEEILNKQLKVKLVDNVKLNIPKIVCISDTHMKHNNTMLETGDILICCGDITTYNNKDYMPFIKWMSSMDFKYKIVIAGNHDKSIEQDSKKMFNKCKKYGIIYLQDSGVMIDGLKFWGTPWTPKRKKNNNDAFTLSRNKLIDKWNLIPNDTNILITHCPPMGIGDNNTKIYTTVKDIFGDYTLLKTINRLSNLKLHLFGHSHYGRGKYYGSFEDKKGVYFINCAVAEYNCCYTTLKI
jgi:Icc-related predicted phosphoesterase